MAQVDGRRRKKGGPHVGPIPDYFSYEDLESYTNEFSEENFIGNFQFGKVYRGICQGEEVVVKVWDEQLIYEVCPGDLEEMIEDELKLHRHLFPFSHPNLPKLIGYCWENELMGCVYYIKPLDALNNLIPEDSFTWLERIKVALGLASVLEFLHSHTLPYLVRNIDAAHIMVDLDHIPTLFDFSMISGGIFTDKSDLIKQHFYGCYGYIDPTLAQGGWSDKCDVFSFGVVLLGLVSKRVYMEEDRMKHAPFVYEWAVNEYNPGNKFSLVHHSLEGGPNFHSEDGIEVTKLALQCVDYNRQKRPTMRQVVRRLKELLVVRDQSHTLVIEQSKTKKKIRCHCERCWNMKPKAKRPTHKFILFDSTDDSTTLLITQPPRQCSVESHSGSGCTGCNLGIGQRNPTISQAGKECGVIQTYSYEDLCLCTDGFSEENFIGDFQFGKVFHGEMKGQMVTVKVWVWDHDHEYAIYYERANASRLRNELILLRHRKLVSHPNLVKLIGYCQDGKHLGVVYDLKPLNTLHNLLLMDNFSWSERIKVAIAFACLLKFLHTPDPPHLPFLVLNIAATHIMLDQECNLKLFDFGMSAGGIFPPVPKLYAYRTVQGCDGYMDSDRGGGTRECGDVFSFGILLVALIAKKVSAKEELSRGEPCLDDWVKSEFEAKMSNASNKSEFSLVHESLEQDPSFYSRDGFVLTKLAMQCIQDSTYQRPKMKQVVKSLLSLRIVRESIGMQMVHLFSP